MNFLRRFFKDEDGLGTVELIILIAVLVAVALIFGDTIKGFVESQLKNVTEKASKGVNEL